MPILELFPSKGALLLFVSTSVGAHTTCPDGLRGESVKTTVRQHFFGTRQHFFGTRNPITKHMDELFCLDPQLKIQPPHTSLFGKKRGQIAPESEYFRLISEIVTEEREQNRRPSLCTIAKPHLPSLLVAAPKVICNGFLGETQNLVPSTWSTVA